MPIGLPPCPGCPTAIARTARVAVPNIGCRFPTRPGGYLAFSAGRHPGLAPRRSRPARLLRYAVQDLKPAESPGPVGALTWRVALDGEGGGWGGGLGGGGVGLLLGEAIGHVGVDLDQGLDREVF